MKEVQELIRQFNAERGWFSFHTPENLAKSISIEAGELLECFQWSPEYDLEHVREELADVMIYCLLMTDAIGADPAEMIMSKMKKNAVKYPLKKEE